MNKKTTTGEEVLRAVATHGSIAAAARALGISDSTFHRWVQNARATAGAAVVGAAASMTANVTAAEPKTAPVAPAMADLAGALAALAAGQAQTNALLAALLSGDAKRPPPGFVAPVPPAPVAEKPRVRVAAGSAPLPRPAMEQNVNVGRFQPEFASPLGDDRPYAGTIFGVAGVRAPVVLAPVSSSRPLRVLAIGDSHFHPGLLRQTRRCMTLIGLYAASKQRADNPFSHVVHIGDGSDWASTCRHTRNDTWKARQKPSIAQDLDCFRSNWQALNEPMDAAGVTAARHYTLGNHDAWLENFEDATPEAKGMATGQRDATLRDAGWTHSAYGEFAFVGGVGFVHVPLNLMGKPVGGQAPENSVATQATHDVVFGHTHRFNACRRVKAGFSNAVTVVNTGGAMPEFYVGDYAQNSMGSAVTSGVVDLFIVDGRIAGHRMVPMRELEAVHGKAADRLLRGPAKPVREG